MIDWKQTTYRVARAHGGQHKLAEVLGCHRTTVAHLSAGINKAPTFDMGLRLLALYSEHVEPIPGARELAERVKA